MLVAFSVFDLCILPIHQVVLAPVVARGWGFSSILVVVGSTAWFTGSFLFFFCGFFFHWIKALSVSSMPLLLHGKQGISFIT